jgi:hypothetical protein
MMTLGNNFTQCLLNKNQFYLAKLISVFLVFVCFNASAQISYSCDMDDCGSDWDASSVWTTDASNGTSG